MMCMTIRKTVLLIVFTTTLFLILLLYGSSEALLLGSFANLEEHTVLQNVNRAQLALSSDIDQLNTTLIDWAQWNDTCDFMTDRNQNYIASNLPHGALSQIRLNVILFIDTSGQLVLGRMADLDTKKEMPVPPYFLTHLFHKGSLVCQTESDIFNGIVLLPEGPLIISSQPILTSDGKGPVRGTLIMGRYLDSELKRLSDTTRLPLVIHRINDSNMSSDFAAAQSSILGEKPTLIKPLSEKSIAGYALIRDVYGYPALILSVDLPRDIYQQGQSTIRYFVLFVLLIGLIFTATIIILLEKTFLSKIAQFSLDVHNIGFSGDVSARISVAGKDEISNLASTVNDMLDRIDRSITERKQAEEDLRESHQILDGIINAIPVRVFWKDKDLFFLGCNAIFANDAGFADSKEVVGKDDFQMVWRDQAELYRADDRVVIETGRPKLFIEEPQTTLKGNTICLLTSKIPLRSSDGEIIGVLGTYMDITERKQVESELHRTRNELELRVKERTEELARKNAEMERFIYTVSHDLRSPLISISGFLGIIEQDAQIGDMDHLKADLRIISDSVTKMDALLMGTLELSRIGRVINLPEGVSFRDIVVEALSQTAEKIESRVIQVSIAPNMPIVYVDRMRIVEVLVNLIENSIKYMGTQERPEIEFGQKIEGVERIFFVRDNGMGIDPSQQDKVFELFYKVDKRSEGTGAGLAIIKRIIEVHGGRIWIESEIVKGCTVCFTLPIANVE